MYRVVQKHIQQKVAHISQISLRCGKIFNDDLVTTLQPNVMLKEFSK